MTHRSLSIRTCNVTFTVVLALVASACRGELAVVDTLETRSAGLSRYRSTGPGPNASCACAGSESLMALSCGGGEVPLLENDIVQTTHDGSIVAFNLCDGLAGECNVVYWDGGFVELPIASGMLLGLSASGAHVLTTGDGTEPGLQLIDLNGTTTIPLQMTVGRGSLSATGASVLGEVFDEEGRRYLARASTSTAEVEVIGELPATISRLYVNPEGSRFVGWATAIIETNETFDLVDTPFHGGPSELSFEFPGVPEGTTIWPESLSDDGSVIAGRAPLTSAHFRWSEAEGYVELAPASGRSGTLLSADGSVVLGSLDPEGPSDSSAFRWTAATGAVEIAPGTQNLATDMSRDGSVIVATSWEDAQLDGAPPEHTFIWDEANGARTLDEVLAARNVDVTGWEFGHARVLSGNGKVLLGRGTCGGVPTLYRVVLSD